MTYQQAYEEHGSIKRAAAAFNIPYTTFHNRLKKEKAGQQVPPIERGALTPKQTHRSKRPRVAALSERELLATHDPYEKARVNMEQVPSFIDSGAFVKDYEMRKAIGLSGDSQLFRELAEDPEMGLLCYQFVMGKGNKETIYWTDPETKTRVLEERPLIARDILPSMEED